MNVSAKFLLMCSFFVTSTFFSDVSAETEVTRAAPDLPPIVLSYDNLAEIIEKLHKLLTKANGVINMSESEMVTLVVHEGSSNIWITGWESITGKSGLPNPGDALFFEYRKYGAPISKIEIKLSDYERKISVTGVDDSQIIAVFAYLKEQLSRHDLVIGGNSQRLWIFLSIILSGSFIIIFQTDKVINRKMYFIEIYIIFVILSFFLVAVKWPPGFAIYTSKINWLDRNVNRITLFGFFISLLPFFNWLKNKYKQIQSDNT